MIKLDPIGLAAACNLSAIGQLPVNPGVVDGHGDTTIHLDFTIVHQIAGNPALVHVDAGTSGEEFSVVDERTINVSVLDRYRVLASVAIVQDTGRFVDDVAVDGQRRHLRSHGTGACRLRGCQIRNAGNLQ